VGRKTSAYILLPKREPKVPTGEFNCPTGIDFIPSTKIVHVLVQTSCVTATDRISAGRWENSIVFRRNGKAIIRQSI
jgi:hypothetical protein